MPNRLSLRTILHLFHTKTIMLIGITGTIGAGKGVAVEYFTQLGFKHYSARSYFTKILEEQRIEVTRPNMIFLANSLRQEHGGAYIIEQLIKDALKEGGNAVVESIRALEEVDILKQYEGILIGITANQQTRYQRVIQRGTSLDNITFEQFKFDEHVEGSSTDPKDSNIFACLEHCDIIFENNDTIENFHHQIHNYVNNLNLNQQ